jgi:hypothetical protein
MYLLNHVMVRPSVIPVIFNVYIVIATDVFIPLLMTGITEGLTITWFNRYIVRAEFNVYIVIATDVLYLVNDVMVRPSVIPVISSGINTSVAIMLMTGITEGLTITSFTRYIVRAEFNVYIVIATDVFIPLLMTGITEGLTITWFNRYLSILIK